jgi:hypothetical protein
MQNANARGWKLTWSALLFDEKNILIHYVHIIYISDENKTRIFEKRLIAIVATAAGIGLWWGVWGSNGGEVVLAPRQTVIPATADISQ